jgi:hypothetical protein
MSTKDRLVNITEVSTKDRLVNITEVSTKDRLVNIPEVSTKDRLVNIDWSCHFMHNLYNVQSALMKALCWTDQRVVMT